MISSQKSEAILDAAEELFTHYGFKKTSIDDVGKKARVAKATIYAFCDSKEQLFYRVIERELTRWLAATATQVDPNAPAPELLAALAMAGIEYLDSRPLLQDLYTGKTVALIPDWRDHLRSLRERTVAIISQVVQLGIDQGHFRKDLDPAAAAGFLDDLQLAQYVFHRPELKRKQRDRRMAAGLDFVLRGLLKRKK